MVILVHLALRLKIIVVFLLGFLIADRDTVACVRLTWLLLMMLVLLLLVLRLLLLLMVLRNFDTFHRPHCHPLFFQKSWFQKVGLCWIHYGRGNSGGSMCSGSMARLHVSCQFLLEDLTLAYRE